MDLRKKKIAK